MVPTTIVNGVYKPSYNWGPHIVYMWYNMIPLDIYLYVYIYIYNGYKIVIYMMVITTSIE